MSFSTPDSSLLNRLAWRITAGLAAAFALIAVLLHQELLPGMPRRTDTQSLSPAPTTKANSLLSFVDPSRRVQFCAQHVTPERSFVVFQNGTCVIVNEPSTDPIGEAKKILQNTSGPEARFVTRRIEEGHLMVTYREPVFHCLFIDEIAQLGGQPAAQFSKHLSPAERRTMPTGWSPPAEAQLGLLTRTSLNEDAAHLQVAKVVRSKPVPEEGPNADVDPSPTTLQPPARPAPLQANASETSLTP